MQKIKPYSCIVIDDEANAIANMIEYISEMPELKLIKTFTDPAKAMKEILIADKVDIIFMDIDMPVIDGIELSKALRHKVDKLIFTTAHTKYAFDAFELSASAFLLKPITLTKFTATINKLFPSVKENEPAKDTENKDFFFVKNTDGHHKIEKIWFKDVIAIESVLNYIKIHTVNNRILTYQSLSSIKKNLAHKLEFIQVQRSFIISTTYIENLDKNVIALQNGMKITIGDRYKGDLMNFVKNNTMKAGKN